jgi:hypothetical protein
MAHVRTDIAGGGGDARRRRDEAPWTLRDALSRADARARVSEPDAAGRSAHDDERRAAAARRSETAR